MTIANYIQYKSCTCKLKCYDTPHQAPSKSYRYIVSPCWLSTMWPQDFPLLKFLLVHQPGIPEISLFELTRIATGLGHSACLGNLGHVDL